MKKAGFFSRSGDDSGATGDYGAKKNYWYNQEN